MLVWYRLHYLHSQFHNTSIFFFFNIFTRAFDFFSVSRSKLSRSIFLLSKWLVKFGRRVLFMMENSFPIRWHNHVLNQNCFIIEISLLYFVPLNMKCLTPFLPCLCWILRLSIWSTIDNSLNRDLKFAEDIWIPTMLNYACITKFTRWISLSLLKK